MPTGAEDAAIGVTANEAILNAVIRHQIYLLRYSTYIRSRIAKLLNLSEADLARRIRDALRLSEGLTTPVEWQRLQALLKGIDAIRMESWDKATQFLTDQMEQLSYQEPIIFQGIYQTTIPVQISTVLPSTQLLKTIALSRPFEGRVLKDWAASLAAEDLRRIHAAVQAGMVAGEDSATIARRVIGTAAAEGRDGITQMTRNQVEAVVRTAVQHVANSSRAAFFDANSDVITEELFVATLDSRTTPICRALDGHHYEVGKGPQPPLHFNCRSCRVAVVDDQILSARPAKPATMKQLLKEYAELNGLGKITSRDDLPRGTKGDFDAWSRTRLRELIGQVPGTETYQTWLEKQSVAFQEEVLGVAKAKLFRDGGLTLDKFVDLNGRELTLHELAQAHAEAFIAAGLDPTGF